MNETKSVKKAMYLEFCQPEGKTSHVVQMIITPERRDENPMNSVALVVYRRRISDDSPKSVWKSYQASTKSTASVDTEAQARNIGKIRLSHATDLFLQLQKRGYVLRRQPIVVDFTDADYQDTRQLKTPYKVLNRILKSRIQLGFESLPIAKK
jgi:hypothetical protein